MIRLLYQSDIKDGWVIIGFGYTFILLVVAAYLNFYTPYNSDPSSRPAFTHWIIWAMLYVPLLVFPVMAKWEVSKMGFSVNPLSMVISLLAASVCGFILQSLRVSWSDAAIEAFARSGEEIFFRGFLFNLLLEVFPKKRAPWIWAAVISSVLFALVHTQTFQPTYFSDRGSSPTAYLIVESLANVFLIGLGFSCLRYWTKSVLPGAILHGMIQAGPLTLPFTILYHAVIVLWARSRGEDILME